MRYLASFCTVSQLLVTGTAASAQPHSPGHRATAASSSVSVCNVLVLSRKEGLVALVASLLLPMVRAALYLLIVIPFVFRYHVFFCFFSRIIAFGAVQHVEFGDAVEPARQLLQQ
jgi:hypothetical protein